jgi:hypothetical protein
MTLLLLELLFFSGVISEKIDKIKKIQDFDKEA